MLDTLNIQPKVSMVVPCYNKVQWISAMFDSILAQKWDNIELILVNDGSTDGTREIIADYEPKFRARGYDVVIIDQENQGRAAAVKHGLMRVTGEYVCMPDCDDRLYPEYVSAMAEMLIENELYDCVVCDSQKSPYDRESSACLKHCDIDGMVTHVYPYKLLESLLMGRISISVCKVIFRVRMLKSASVITNFVTEPRDTQEYQVWLPLALKGIQIVSCRRVLYHQNFPDIRKMERERFTSMESSVRCIDATNEIVKKTLQGLSSCYSGYHSQLRKILSCYAKQCFYNLHYGDYNDRYARETLTYINKTRLLKKSIAINVAERAGTIVLFRYFSNHVIGYPQRRVNICRKSEDGKIVAYAAFGRAASIIRHGLLHSDIRPDVFWDIAAKPDDQIDGIPVLKPEFESLSQNDTVLVLLKDMTIAQPVKDHLMQTTAKDNVWYFYDVWDYLANYFFD